MQEMKKRMLSLALALLLVTALALPAMASEEEATPLTRGNVISMMFQLLGVMDEFEPAAFTDVAADDPLMTALSWAASWGIVNGYGNGTFGPDEAITREQMAAMLYRYVQKLDMGYTGSWMFLLDYPDAAEISD